MDILALLQPINGCLSKTTFQQMSRVILALLAMMGRVTMLGLSHWAGDGGSYRTIQRFYQTAIPWGQMEQIIRSPEEKAASQAKK